MIIKVSLLKEVKENREADAYHKKSWNGIADYC